MRPTSEQERVREPTTTEALQRPALSATGELIRLSRKPRTAAGANAALANAWLRNSEFVVTSAVMEATRKKDLDPALLAPTSSKRSPRRTRI
jgi:hypothetical protein